MRHPFAKPRRPSRKTKIKREPYVAEPTSIEETELLLKFYLHQWDQVRHLETMRERLSLQALTIAAASIVGYFAAKENPGIQLGLALVVTSIGLVGYKVVVALEKASNIHIDRARALRRHLDALDLVATKIRGFYPLAKYFISLSFIVATFELALLVHAAFRTDFPAWTTLASGVKALVCAIR